MWSETGLLLNSGTGNNQYLKFDDFGPTLAGDEFTLRLSFTTNQANPIFLSYATAAEDNELSVRCETQKLTVYLNGRVWDTGIDSSLLTDGQRHEIGIVRSVADGALKIFVDGVLKDSRTGFQTGFQIGNSGMLVMGQEQDVVGGQFDSNQIFSGTYWDQIGRAHV